MIDLVHYTYFPEWDEMDFSQECRAWGEWFTAWLTNNPWNRTYSLDGDISGIIKLFSSSLRPDWHMPKN